MNIENRFNRKEGASLIDSFAYSPDMAAGFVMLIEFLIVFTTPLILMMPFDVDLSEYGEQHIFIISFISILFIIIGSWANLYTVSSLSRPISVMDAVLVTVTNSYLFCCSIIFGLDIAYFFDMRWLTASYAATLIALLGVRFATAWALAALSRRGMVGRAMVVLGDGEQLRRLLRKIRTSPPPMTRVVGVFAPAAGGGERAEVEGFPVLGSTADLMRFARTQTLDDVVVAMPWSLDRTVTQTVEQLKELPVNVYLSSDLVGFDLTFRPALGMFGPLPLHEVVRRPIAGWSSAAKRVFDCVLAALALVLLMPLLAIVAVAIRLDSPGPIFFMQQRLGFNNKPFAIYKFRSMRHDPEGRLPVVQATRRDPRVTRVGAVLRATSIDELPQLLNVLDGTMSLVGPRPHALNHNAEYSAQIRGYFARHKVKPGITGWAQVNGLRGETEIIDKMEARVQHDVYYAENWSIFFDVKILILTILVVFFQKSAY